MLRRQVLVRLAQAGWAAVTLNAGPALAASGGRSLIAAWDDASGRHHVGLLSLGDVGGTGRTDGPDGPESTGVLSVLDAIEVPTRAHGLLALPDGSMLAAARRPGEWLLRWRPGRRTRNAATWHWCAPDRRQCGHAVLDRHGRLLTTEMDLEQERGLVVVRDAASLATLHEWPTHGIDPHELLLDSEGQLLVANGGVPTQTETGRTKLDRSRMDSSLVRLAASDGQPIGQWRLADHRLSIRHLALHVTGRVGVALQAEHEEATAREAAPVLAVFDGQSLQTAAPAAALAGYGGSIVADAAGFVVSATRAGLVTRWFADGRWRGSEPLADACPAAMVDGRLIAGGRSGLDLGETTRRFTVPELRLDNHWVLRAG